MGGYSSGRYRTRNRGNVDAACRIDIRYLRRIGALREGGSTTGTLRWTLQGRETGSVGYVVTLKPDDRHLVITFSHKGENHRHVIRLEAAPMRFGVFATTPFARAGGDGARFCQ